MSDAPQGEKEDSEVLPDVLELKAATEALEKDWLERVNRALWKYDRGELDVRGVAAELKPTLAKGEVIIRDSAGVPLFTIKPEEDGS